MFSGDLSLHCPCLATWAAPGAALKLLLTMSTDSSAWTPLCLCSALSQRGGVQGTAESPASAAIPAELLSLSGVCSSSKAKLQPAPFPLILDGHSWVQRAPGFCQSSFQGSLTFPKASCFHLTSSMISQLAVHSGLSCGQWCDGGRGAPSPLIPSLLWALSPPEPPSSQLCSRAFPTSIPLPGHDPAPPCGSC